MSRRSGTTAFAKALAESVSPMPADTMPSSMTGELPPVVASLRMEDLVEAPNGLFDLSKVDRILNYVINGMPLPSACRVVGITQATFQEWRDRFPIFNEAIETALGHFEWSIIRPVVQTARGGDMQTARWLLGVRFPDSWEPVNKLEVNIKRMTDAELAEFIRTAQAKTSIPGYILPVPTLESLTDVPESAATSDVVVQSE